MDSPQVVGTLTFLWLISLMFRMGLSVPIRAVLDSLTQTRFLLKALLANFFLVPLIAWGLLAFFQPNPIVSFGFMIVVVFAGAPFGPAFATIAKGDTSLAIGMMIFLAALSVPISPAVLAFLLGYLPGSSPITLDHASILKVMLLGQLAPLGAGLAVGAIPGPLKVTIAKPAKVLSQVLMAGACSGILITEANVLREFGHRAYIGMLVVFVSSMVIGWLLGGPGITRRKTMMFITTIRNSAAALAIVSTNYAGTEAPAAALAYTLFFSAGALIAALLMGKRKDTHVTQ